MFSTIQKEASFNLSCYAMARNNVSQAVAYMRTVVTNIVTPFVDDSTSPSLKDRCVNLVKASGLLVRVPLLCVPFINRATQLALRLLSPKLSIDSNFSEEELLVRYSEEALHTRSSQIELNVKTERIANGKTYIQKKQQERETIALGDLQKLGLSDQDIKELCDSMASQLRNQKKGKALKNFLKAFPDK